MAVDGDTAIVGAFWEDAGGEDAGAAYVFAVNSVSGEWEEVEKLIASDAQASDQFGYSVAISGETAVVGANGVDGTGLNSGAAYVFAVNSVSGEWEEVKKLTASDAQATDHFGFSVAISGETAVVGARDEDPGVNNAGSAYVFVVNSVSGEWEEVGKLSASDAGEADQFGSSIAICGKTAVVGASWEDSMGDMSGAAYVFVVNSVSGEWEEAAKLTASDVQAGQIFGHSVAVSGDIALVGAPWDGSNAGAAYVFAVNPVSGKWEEAAKLTASDTEWNDEFGWSVAVGGDTALVGARLADSIGNMSGAAYVFAVNSVSREWEEVKKLTASDAQAGDQFGWSVAMSGESAAVGARFKDTAGTDAGAAYLFE